VKTITKTVIKRLAAACIAVSLFSIPAGADEKQGSKPEKEARMLHGWSKEELRVLRSLSLSALPPLPKDPSNIFADDLRAIALGRKIFFDEKFSANGKISCATCHQPLVSFTDKLPLAKGMGTTSRRSMPLIGAAYNSWFFWDGRKDSLWSQAIGPIESTVEHGITRTQCAHIIAGRYRKEYEEIFGKLPKITHQNCPVIASPGTGSSAALKAWQAMKPKDRDAVNRIYANIGKAIAAFVRQIIPEPAPFDLYADAVQKNNFTEAARLMSSDAVEGLRLFIGKAKCTNCHNGPLFTNSSFHNIGLRTPDKGRAEGIDKALSDEFNCLGKYSDAKPEECAELRFIDTDRKKYISAFKTPTLRNVADRAPYMHAGQFNSLSDVLAFYRRGLSSELEHGELTDKEMLQIEEFLKTLSGPLRYPK
jgi:cytochrome c peroxidase